MPVHPSYQRIFWGGNWQILLPPFMAYEVACFHVQENGISPG
jgi:hypothetical protein